MELTCFTRIHHCVSVCWLIHSNSIRRVGIQSCISELGLKNKLIKQRLKTKPKNKKSIH